MSTLAKDLTKEAPSSPKYRVGGYAILARLADKARADFLGGKVGDYHTNCPLDHLLIDWKGVSYDEVKKVIVDGGNDQAVAEYLDSHGTPKTHDEVSRWSDSVEKINPYENPEKREWYKEQVEKLGLDPATTPMLDWLDADDKKTFGK